MKQQNFYNQNTNNGADDDVITIIPQSQLMQEYGLEEHQYQLQSNNNKGALRRWLWDYVHLVGQDFNLVLFVSLVYQFSMALLIGLNSVNNLPFLSGIAQSSNLIVAGLTRFAVIIAALFIQILLIAELAQVVWLRRPDWLKVRLMSDSVWWWIMLISLIVTVIVYFLLLCLSATGQSNLVAAWQTVTVNQVTGLTNLLLTVLNFLTLLRCASVMRTSTTEEIKKAVEERIEAQGQEILMDASDAVREKTKEVWRILGLEPKALVPIYNSVIHSISMQYPHLVPAQAVGNQKLAYDFNANAFVELPADVKYALLQNYGKVQGQKIKELATSNRNTNQIEEKNELWGMPPQAIAKRISSNLQQKGRATYLNVADPRQVRYADDNSHFNKAIAVTGEFRQLSGNDFSISDGMEHTEPTSTSQWIPTEYPIRNVSRTTKIEYEDEGAISTSGVNSDEKYNTRIQARHNLPHTPTIQDNSNPILANQAFAEYLRGTIYPAVNDSTFPAGLSVFEVFKHFSENEINFYYTNWSRNKKF